VGQADPTGSRAVAVAAGAVFAVPAGVGAQGAIRVGVVLLGQQ
jgi:hypothetical protein